MISKGNRDAWGNAWRRAGRRWEELAPALRRATGWKIWNPGIYGERWHVRFRRRYPPRDHPLLIFGLNPGPYGMAQTGIPFTDIRRLVASLPELALELRKSGEAVEVPGLAPADLRPFLGRSFESSSVRVYRFLERGWGSAELGWSDMAVANPCTLLFIDPAEGKNRTPADLGHAARAHPRGAVLARALGEKTDRLRVLCATEAVEALDPRAVILFGKDVQGALGPALSSLLGERKVIPWEHPARAVPEAWAGGLLSAIRSRGLAPRTSRPAGRLRK
jgi:single-strand selective monofunctional uracil DNA glycosylase